MDVSVAVTDDVETDRLAIARDVHAALAAYPGVAVRVSAYASAEEMLAAFEPGAFQLAFLDVRLEGADGISLAAQLRRLDADLLIVFVTTEADYALTAYPTHPFDFLVKPYGRRRLAEVCRDALRALGARDEELTLKVPYGTICVPVGAVVAFESHGHTPVVRLASGREVQVRMSFSELASLVADESRFLACNRGLILNMDHVVRLDGDVAVTDDGGRHPLRMRDRGTLARKINQHMIVRMRQGTGRG